MASASTNYDFSKATLSGSSSRYSTIGTSSDSDSKSIGNPLLPVRAQSIFQLSTNTTPLPHEYVLPGVDHDAYIIFAIACSVRIYHSGAQHHGNALSGLGFSGKDKFKSKDDGDQWSYSHLKGTLVFGKDKGSTTTKTKYDDTWLGETGSVVAEEWWFQLVDENTNKTVWKFKIPLSNSEKSTSFQYELDRPFFHVFRGSSRKYGFLFNDDKESSTFSSQVHSNLLAAQQSKSSKSQSHTRVLSVRSKKSKSKSKSSPKESSSSSSGSLHRDTTHTHISPSHISSPTPSSFKHVAHIGINPTNGVLETSKDLDPSYREILADLYTGSNANMSESVVLEHLDFIQGFWKDIDTMQMQRSGNHRPIPAN